MQIVTPTRFKQLNRNRVRTGSTVGLRKQMVGDIEVVSAARGDDRRLRFTISTASVDREQDTIAVSGWDLRQYLRNPVVLWGHDAAALPIGRALDVGIEAGALKATVEWYKAYQSHQDVRQLTQEQIRGYQAIQTLPLVSRQ